MASIYLTLKNLVVDCQKLYNESDEGNVPANLNRTISVALKALGTLGMLSSAMDAYYNRKSLPYILLRGTVGHEIFAMGSSLGEKADRLSGDASTRDAVTAAVNKGINYIAALSKGNAEMTASYKELLKYTWVLKHI